MREMKKGDATLMLLHTCWQWWEAENPGNEGIWQRQNMRILNAVEAPETVRSTNPSDLTDLHLAAA